MGELYELFLKYLPHKAKILDLGCGSGRDTKFFLQNGYDVIATDGSLEMVKLSTLFTGKQTLYMTFDELDFLKNLMEYGHVHRFYTCQELKLIKY